MTDWRYAAVLFAAIGTVLVARSILNTHPIALLITATEALGIGLNSVYGSQKALDARTSVYAAVIVGLVNAVGGRLMRDTVMGRKRKNLVPGRMFGVASVVSIGVFLLMSEYLQLDVQLSAWTAIISGFAIRMIAVKWDIKTKALTDYYDPSERVIIHVSKVVNPYVSKVEKLKVFNRKNGSEPTEQETTKPADPS